MKYQKTIDLWDNGVQEDIRSGKLKLQRGQWCKCGSDGRPVRFVRLMGGGSVWVVHSDDKSTTANFKRALDSIRKVRDLRQKVKLNQIKSQ